MDPNYLFNHRFNSNHYINGNWTLSYLVSRIDGQSLEEIELMIDRHVQADKSGEGLWILDGDPAYGGHNSDVIATKNKFVSLGFNFEFDSGDPLIVTSEQPVIGYTSQGLHADDNYPYYPGLDSGYVHDQLQFEYLDGAIFSSYESFNYYSNYAIYGRDDHGLVAEFVTRRPQDYQAGTGGNGHTWEPFANWYGGTVKNQFYFPAYAMGYSVVDAAYLGMPYVGFVNIVAGDPLTTIAWGKQQLSEYSTTWSGKNLVTGEITIPIYKSLIIEDDSYIELRHQGFIPCNPSYGRLYAGQNVTFESDDWQRSLFLSYNSQHARIIWAAHPSFPTISYNVYRKINEEGNWNLIANTMENEYTDEEVQLTCYECPINAVVYYKVTAVSQLQESDYSNEVSAEVITKVHKNMTEDQGKGELNSFSLSQNYPNPFNPTTTISYSVKEVGVVELKVYDVLGKVVAVLVNEQKSSGNYSVIFNAENIPSGIYFYKLSSGSFTETKKLILLK